MLFFRRMDASLAFKKLQPEDFYKAHIDQGVRPDGRGSLTASRPVSISVGSIGTADGSAIVKQVTTHYSHVTNRLRDSKKLTWPKKALLLMIFSCPLNRSFPLKRSPLNRSLYFNIAVTYVSNYVLFLLSEDILFTGRNECGMRGEA